MKRKIEYNCKGLTNFIQTITPRMHDVDCGYYFNDIYTIVETNEVFFGKPVVGLKVFITLECRQTAVNILTKNIYFKLFLVRHILPFTEFFCFS